MSSKFTEFDPLSALFRDLSDSDQDVPEPLRVADSAGEADLSDSLYNHKDDKGLNEDEITTQILPVKNIDTDEDSDDDIVEPLSLSFEPPVFLPENPDYNETERVIIKRNMPPKPERLSVSPSEKSNLAREMIEAALQNHQDPPKPLVKSNPTTSGSEQESKSKGAWKNFKRPKSALEMAMELAEEEANASKDEEAATNQEGTEATAAETDLISDGVLLSEHVASLLQPIFPNLENFSVVRAIYVDDRQLFESLWKAHRSKFIFEGRLEYAISTLSVIHALKTAPLNDLVAAHLETNASDYLVWIRPSNGDVLAAFQDARRYFS